MRGLADWFDKLQGSSRAAGEEGKRLLVDRLEREGGRCGPSAGGRSALPLSGVYKGVVRRWVL
jgi:hypothetical protein